jgi:hypothetical protein
MKKLAIIAFVVGLLSLTSAAICSELAEAAKKERARRETVQKQRKPARVFTNQDVANLKSTLAFEASQTEAVEPAEQQQITTLPATDPALGQPEPTPEETARTEEEERLREERETLEQQARDAQQTINQGGGYHTRNIGNQFKTKREAESRIREIDEELKKDEEGNEEEQ